MPTLSNKDQKQLDDLGLPPHTKEAAKRVWEAEDEKSIKGYVVLFTIFALIGILVATLFVPETAPLVNVAVVVTWLGILLYGISGFFMVVTASVLADKTGDKADGFFLNRGTLRMAKGKPSARKAVGWIAHIGLAASLALTGSTVTAFFFVLSVLVLKFGFFAVAENAKKFLAKFEVREGPVEKGDFRNTTGVIEGEYARVS
ncbi:MAG: hypothetical protein QG650_32 [Patescibacteria group bacterium]|nr:hypothetical protein [Patescibacteria group bacterium]